MSKYEGSPVTTVGVNRPVSAIRTQPPFALAAEAIFTVVYDHVPVPFSIVSAEIPAVGLNLSANRTTAWHA
ncbi:MAG: hypothetical protein M0Z95_16155 [Actinomycetota bacterium]|nr:hypothetical protein [Actinomycetota bacterium]